MERSDRFGVVDVTAATHTPGATCPACLAGYPQPCPRVVTRTPRPAPIGLAWDETHCPGFVHAERGDGSIELRCDVDGVPAAPAVTLTAEGS